MPGPIVDATPGTNRELLVVAMGAGSLAASHVNDAGFWLVKEYFGLSVGQTVKTWSRSTEGKKPTPHKKLNSFCCDA